MKSLLAFLLSLASSICHAQTFGSWFVGLDDDGAPYMATANDSGNLLGKWCDGKERSCYWLITAPNRCATGTEADGLISSSLGVSANTTICGGPKELDGKTTYRNVLTKPESIDQMVRKSPTFSFVMALDGDNFKVMRFPMKGASDALDRWQSLVAAWIKRLPPSTKDTVL